MTKMISTRSSGGVILILTSMTLLWWTLLLSTIILIHNPWSSKYFNNLPSFVFVVQAQTVAAVHEQQQQQEQLTTLTGRHCHEYGCSIYPPDLIDQKVYNALAELRRRHEEEASSIYGLDHDHESSSSSSSPRDDNKSDSKTFSSSSSSDRDILVIEEEDDTTNTKFSPIIHVLSQDYNSKINGKGATLTLVGNNSGKLEKKINQDRAVIVSPFYATKQSNNRSDDGSDDDDDDDANEKECASSSCSNLAEDEQSKKKKMKTMMTTNNNKDFIVGVFDGHGRGGEAISQYATIQFPNVLSKNLEKSSSNNRSVKHTTTSTSNTRELQVVNAIISTFLQIDETCPKTPASTGGTSASIAYREDNKIYIANAGDSRTFLATYNSNTRKATILYITREDKPHLPEEKARVESAGGRVYYTGSVSRLLGKKPESKKTWGLAMSRSIGDHNVIGAIPDPIVKVLDIEKDIIQPVKEDKKGQKRGLEDVTQIEVSSTMDVAEANKLHDVIVEVEQEEDNNNDSNSDDEEDDDEINIFIVSATDGLLDYLEPLEIANHIGSSLFSFPKNEITNEATRGKKRKRSSSIGGTSTITTTTADDATDARPVHILSACQDLIRASVKEWRKEYGNHYRDDIAIAVKAVVV